MRSAILSGSALVMGLVLSAAPPALSQGLRDCGEGAGVPCQLPDGTRVTPPVARALPECVEAPEPTDVARYICVSGRDVLFDEEALADPAAAGVLAEVNALLGRDAPAVNGAAAETAAAEQEATDAPAAEAQAEQAPATTEEAQPAPAVTEQAVEAPIETEQQTEAPAETEQQAEAPAETEQAATASGETAPEPAAPAPESEAAVAEMSPAAKIRAEIEERQQKILERLNREAATQDQSAAAATGAGDSGAAATPEVVVEEQTVTEADARTSSEEFDTRVGGTSAASATATAERDEGLSAFEKALLVGLGAIAVGQILDNGDEIVSNSGDRVVVRRDGELFVLKDDDALLRQPGSTVRTERFSDGSTREIVTREDGVQIVTVRAADGRVLRRGRILPDGTRVLLFDDTQTVEPVRLEDLPDQQARTITVDRTDEEALRRALEAAMVEDIGRSFSLRQIRDIREVRELAPEIEVDAVTFETGSSVIRPDQARELADLGRALRDLIEESPGEVFLVEGHTDATGGAEYNLALSDRRAETLALALTEYFDVPPENMIVQGYGETALKVPTPDAERANRRALVRRITPLLKTDLTSNF